MSYFYILTLSVSKLKSWISSGSSVDWDLFRKVKVSLCRFRSQSGEWIKLFSKIGPPCKDGVNCLWLQSFWWVRILISLHKSFTASGQKAGRQNIIFQSK